MSLVELEDLSLALALGPHEHVAVVGGGGKTTIVHALGRQLSGTRILTTTTKMGFDQHSGAPVRLLDTAGTAAAGELIVGGELVVVWAAIDEPVALGVDPAFCDGWFAEVDHVIVEADGARRRPFKAPAPYEPVVPSTATVMISTVGADALNEVIEDRCHRPELVAELGRCRPWDRLTPQIAARVLLSEHGNKRALPPRARLIVATTKVDSSRAGAAAELAAIVSEEADVDHVAIRHTAAQPQRR